MKKILYAILVAALSGLALMTFLMMYRGDLSTLVDDPLTVPGAGIMQRGEYLARVGDCISCHTAAGAATPFGGGFPIESPLGLIYASNITPDQSTGIGAYTLRDFDNAVRYGVRKDGATLYPAMPYPSFAGVSDEDIKALYAYFMRGVQPVENPAKPNTIPWPLGLRWPLNGWRLVFAPRVEPFRPGDGNDETVNRGAYLTQGLGHCGACHTPRAVTLNEQAMADTGRHGSLYLSGGSGLLDGYVAVNIRGDMRRGIGAWTEDDLVELFKTGRNRFGAVFGGMSAVIVNSLQYLTDDDLHAMARYLKTLPAADPADIRAFVYDEAAARALYRGDVSAPGAAYYVDACATCHRTDGRGYDRVFPPLAGNPTVQSRDPSSLINLVIAGHRLDGTMASPTDFAMPGQGWRYNDDQIAALLTFVRTSWGNAAEPVTTPQVRKIRAYLNRHQR